MKKFLFACVSLTLISIFFLSGLSGYRSLQGDDVRVYTRFFTTDSTGTHFNWYGIFSPVQTETQKTVTHTMKFSHKVIYPYGKNFQCIAPDDSTAEEFVAQEIARVINDSLTKISYNTSFDYDKTSLAVRKSANPSTRQLAKPTVILSLFGTASPEARKYGFQESLMPGHIEPENTGLSGQRLERTAARLEQKGFPATVKSWQEIQFRDTASALSAVANPYILDTMRYVQANVVMPVQRLEITPVTVPVLLPIWLWLLPFSLMLLWRLRLPKMQRPKFEWGEWSWGGLWDFLKILLSCIGVSALVTAMLMFFDWRWLLLFLIPVVIGFLWAMIKTMKPFFLWLFAFLVDFIDWIANIVMALIQWIRQTWYRFVNWLRYWRRRFLICWACLNPCWKRLFIIVIAYAVAMTALVIYLI